MTSWWRFLYLFRTNDPQCHCNEFFWQSWNNFLHDSLMTFMTTFWFFLSFSRYNDSQCHCNDFWIIIFFHSWRLLMTFSLSLLNDFVDNFLIIFWPFFFLFLGPMMLSVTAMMDLEAPIVHSPMSMNANIGLVPYMQNVQTPWAVLLVRVVKVRNL